MTKFYRYEDPSGSNVLSEEDIIREYYPYWSSLMIKAGRRPDHESCIDDWKVVHWAWEITKEEADALRKNKCR